MPHQKYYLNPIHAVPAYANAEDGVVNMIVEINKGTLTKYEVINETGMLKVDRVGYSSLVYPFTYGEIPGTWDEDNDPLDIELPYLTEPLVPGCIIEVRVIGIMKFVDSDEIDDKVIGVPNDDKRFDHIKDIKDLPEYFMTETKYYWEKYKELKKPGTGVVKGFFGKDEALLTINECIDRYNKDIKPTVQE